MKNAADGTELTEIGVTAASNMAQIIVLAWYEGASLKGNVLASLRTLTEDLVSDIATAGLTVGLAVPTVGVSAMISSFVDGIALLNYVGSSIVMHEFEATLYSSYDEIRIDPVDEESVIITLTFPNTFEYPYDIYCPIPAGAVYKETVYYGGSKVGQYKLDGKLVGPKLVWIDPDDWFLQSQTCYKEEGIRNGWEILWGREYTADINTGLMRLHRYFNDQKVEEYRFYKNGAMASEKWWNYKEFEPNYSNYYDTEGRCTGGDCMD